MRSTKTFKLSKKNQSAYETNFLLEQKFSTDRLIQ